MFNSSFYEIVKNHNQTINIINCALREIEKEINRYIENDPAVTLFSYDPLCTGYNHCFTFDYPNVILSLPPLKITISYREIIENLKGQVDNNLIIEQAIEKIILDHIQL